MRWSVRLAIPQAHTVCWGILFNSSPGVIWDFLKERNLLKIATGDLKSVNELWLDKNSNWETQVPVDVQMCQVTGD